MSSPTTEVKPSQVAQLMKENAKLKKEIEDWKNIDMGLLESEYMMGKNSEIFELKKENEKLKNKTLDNPQKSFDAMCKVVVELQDQIKTLKEKNDELKQFAMKVHNFVYNTKYDDEDIVSSFDFDGILEEMKKDEDKLKEEIEKLKLDCLCRDAERDYVDPKCKFTCIDDYPNFNIHLKENYNDDMYKKMYEWFDMDEMLGLNEEGLTTIMYEGKEYYLDMSDGDNDVYDTSHEIVGKWEMGEIVFNEDEDDKQKMDINELKKHFNNIIYLVKGCDTDEKLQKLKELNTLD